MKQFIEKAAVLTEALPYIQDFKGSVVLVKVGGSVMEVEENLDDPWKELRDKGEEVAYAVKYLDRAKAFVRLVAAERRGFAYLIG